jgi:hypothetical protein
VGFAKLFRNVFWTHQIDDITEVLLKVKLHNHNPNLKKIVVGMTILFNINSNSILFILNIDFFPCDIINHEISPKIIFKRNIINMKGTYCKSI